MGGGGRRRGRGRGDGGGKVVRLLLFIQMGLVPGQEGSGGWGWKVMQEKAWMGGGGGGFRCRSACSDFSAAGYFLRLLKRVVFQT
jgi:hypothetical protein